MTGLFTTPAGQQPVASEIKRGALISKCGRYRFTLSRFWRAGPHVLFLGINPSTADAQADDPTVRRWIHFAAAWGYAGFVAVNAIPLRSASPADARAWSAGEGWDAAAADQNSKILGEEAASAERAVVCFGNVDWAQGEISSALQRIEPHHPDLYCFGVTASGAPIHPMARGRHRIADDCAMRLWRQP